MRRAFIIGCGYTGTQLAQRLTKLGVQVGGISLTAINQGGININVHDIRHPEASQFNEAKEAVVYYLIPPLEKEYDPLHRPHLLHMQPILDILSELPIAGIIYLSSTAVYGDNKGEWVDENTPPNPQSPWGKMRLELEQLIQSFGQYQHVPAAILRLPEIYGKERGPIQRLCRGQNIYPSERMSNRIHLDDLVEVLQLLGHRLDCPLLLVSDGNPAPLFEVYQYAAELIGLQQIPWATIKEVDANHLAMVNFSRRCSNKRLLDWLGRPLRYPSYREGLLATLDDSLARS